MNRLPEPDPWLARLRRVLEQARVQRRTMTYLQVADALDMPGPKRIHQTTRLIERLLAEDVRAGRAPLAALAISRARDGLPAPGFFDRARRLGLDPTPDPRSFHQALLRRLFECEDTPK